MESTITALEMRKKFGGILDRVMKKGDHITIMRGHVPLATLIPASEHDRRCSSKDRLRTVKEALAELDAWQRREPHKFRSKKKSEQIIRKMRNSRWSSSIRRSH